MITRHFARHFDIAPYQEGVNNGEEITWNLDGLTRGIPKYSRVGDIPLQYQRHTVGVSDWIFRLLIRVV